MPTPVNLEIQRRDRIFDHLLALNLISLPTLKMTSMILSSEGRLFPYWNVFGWEVKLRRVGYGI